MILNSCIMRGHYWKLGSKRQMADFYRIPQLMTVPFGSNVFIPNIFMPPSMYVVNQGGPNIFMPPSMHARNQGGSNSFMEQFFKISPHGSPS